MGINVGGSIITSNMLTIDGTVINENFTPVTADMIHSYELANSTLMSAGNDGNGMYSISAYHNAGGCGNPNESGIWVKIKSDVIPWTRVICKFSFYGTAACWGFNGGGFGSLTDQSGNMLNYDTSQGDIIFRPDATNSFNLTQFQVKNSACDNDSNNFFHGSYQTGDPKSFYMLSRRKTSNSNPAGPVHGRSCNATGTGAYTIISEMYIF